MVSVKTSKLNKKALNELSKVAKELGFSQLAKDIKKAKTKARLQLIKKLIIKDLRTQAGKRFIPVSKGVQVMREKDKKANVLINRFERKFNLFLSLI